MEDIKTIENYAEMLYLMRVCLTREEALKKSAKDLKAYDYIAKMGSLFDIEFN